MSEKFTNYRKAKKNEITCLECYSSKSREWFHIKGSIECDQPYGHGCNYRVGKNMTCDGARLKAKKEVRGE